MIQKAFQNFDLNRFMTLETFCNIDSNQLMIQLYYYDLASTLLDLSYHDLFGLVPFDLT